MPIMLLPKASFCNYVLLYSNISNSVEKKFTRAPLCARANAPKSLELVVRAMQPKYRVSCC